MLRPIPPRILKHTVLATICTGLDRYQAPTALTVPVKRCVMQPSNETRRTQENTEVVLRGLLFADARLSDRFDWLAKKNESEANGYPLQVTFRGETYTVQTVETLFDDEGNLHHWEVGLV